ncbi:MAG: outer membrane lipoprotein-sorting protein [Pseudomonadota bacterium]
MNKTGAGIFVFLALLMTSPNALALSGREVYEMVHAVVIKGLDRKTEGAMTLYDGHGGERTRTLTEYGKSASPEAYKVLVVFTSPPDLKGVAFLIHAHTFADLDLWAYFPEYKRVRRIPASARDDSFFGSDFSYDDFSGPANLDDYSYRVLKEDVVDEKPCFVIEITPKIRRKYTRYIAWVAKDLWVTLKVEYYREEALYRAGNFGDIRMIDGIPTPFRLEMKNLTTAHRTVLNIDTIRYRTAFPDELFTQQSLERGAQ